MTDVWLKDFWNDIKDPSWSDVDTLDDIMKMHSDILRECYQTHRLDHKLQDINKASGFYDHWTTVLHHGNLGFVPVRKCGHLHFRDIFLNQMAWQEIPIKDFNGSDTQLFGVMMHPLIRYLKGITEWIWRFWKDTEYLPALDQAHPKHPAVTDRLITMIKNSVVPDVHSLPYSLEFGPHLDKIAWIPLGLYDDHEVYDLVQGFFDLHGHDIVLARPRQRIHTSNHTKLQLYELVKKIHYERSYNEHTLIYQIYSQDLKFYHNLLQSFRPDWSHL